MAIIRDIPAGYNPVLPDEAFFEKHAERAYMEAATRLLEPTVCPQCDALFMEGRWHWGPVPVSAHQAVCSACLRMQDHNPAGYVVLAGPYFHEHADEIIALLHDQAERKRLENPLMRLMEEERNDIAMMITTTDIRLAHFLGALLHHHHGGHLEYHHNAAQGVLRVHWTR